MKLAVTAALVSVAVFFACATPRAASVAPTRAEPTRTCGGCHAEEEEAWRKSMHHASFTSRDFQTALVNDPMKFCTDCHAPRNAELGVDCVSCHANAEAHERSPRSIATKRVACESCHELPNPVAATMLQTTATEHAASAYAHVPCADCHRGHEMSVTRNATFIANALEYTVSQKEESVVVALRSKGVGHRFPTGDLFRALLVHAWIQAPDGRIVSETHASLHRDWDAVRRVPGGTATVDTRLGEVPVEIALPAPVTRGAILHLEIDYARGASARGDHFTMFEKLRVIDWTRPLD